MIIQDQWSEIEKKRNDSESEKLVVNYTDKRGKNIRKASDELSEDWRENKKREAYEHTGGRGWKIYLWRHYFSLNCQKTGWFFL